MERMLDNWAPYGQFQGDQNGVGVEKNTVKSKIPDNEEVNYLNLEDDWTIDEDGQMENHGVPKLREGKKKKLQTKRKRNLTLDIILGDTLKRKENMKRKKEFFEQKSKFNKLNSDGRIIGNGGLHLGRSRETICEVDGPLVPTALLHQIPKLQLRENTTNPRSYQLPNGGVKLHTTKSNINNDVDVPHGSIERFPRFEHWNGLPKVGTSSSVEMVEAGRGLEEYGYNTDDKIWLEKTENSIRKVNMKQRKVDGRLFIVDRNKWGTIQNTINRNTKSQSNTINKNTKAQTNGTRRHKY
ncbi:unnamed protein product, partial [Meganyctiphanes norvegica]